MLQQPQPENFDTRSLDEIDFDMAIQIPPSFEKLSKENSKPNRSSSFQSTPATATSSRKVSSCDQPWDTVQSAMLNLVLKKKITIQAIPEVLDFNSYTVTVFGNNQSLSTNERSSKSSKETIVLKSYRTNILKIKPCFLKSSNKKIYLYTSLADKPLKLGEVKKGAKGTQNMNIFGAEGELQYILEDDQSEKQKNLRLSFPFACGASNSHSKPTSGNLSLKDVKTGNSMPLGKYYTTQVVSNDKRKTFNARCYEVEFPSEVCEDTKTLITAALFSKIPKSVHYKTIH